MKFQWFLLVLEILSIDNLKKGINEMKKNKGIISIPALIDSFKSTTIPITNGPRTAQTLPIIE